MRLCWFDDWSLGVIDEDAVLDVSAALGAVLTPAYPCPTQDLLVAHLPLVLDAVRNLDRPPSHRLRDVKLRSPVANPGKLVAAPVNYQAHLDEAIRDQETFSRAHVRRIEETGLFLKATSSLVGASEQIQIRHPERRTDHEIELAVIIGGRCRDVTREEALNYVAGYTIGLDITIRGPEERSLRKSLDTYSVLGPWMVTADEFGDPSGRDLLLTVDGEVRQKANTRDLILDVPALITFASSYYTLHPGDVIFTGTPEGVGPISPGQRIAASIDGIGSLEAEVVSV